MDEAFMELAAQLTGKKIVALTGAGCSTDSGIPDYRGPKTREKVRNPIQYLEFIRKPEVRQRYWARSARGWPWFSAREPNSAHHALATLEHAGAVSGIITQNVDRLHHKAGSRRVVELHGALAEVICLECKRLWDRAHHQERILHLNRALAKHTATVEYAPDGDADIPEELISSFRVPSCEVCGGVLKPHVVFFGENVPRPVVDRAWSLLDEADALLVLGSSLTVYSGFRFIKEAHRRGLPSYIINLGETRGDALATPPRLDAPVGPALAALASALTGG